MSGTSFVCDPDLERIVKQKKEKTGKSQTRIINDALRKAFTRDNLQNSINESIKLHHKSIYLIKKLMEIQGVDKALFKELEKEFEEYYKKIK